MKVLVIDDDTLIVELVAERLKTEGFAVCSANDGLTGIEYMITESPDIVLLDIMMPGIDGFEVCRKLKESPATADMPIVFFSSMNAKKDIDRAYAVGADDYIIKPFDVLTLGQRLKDVHVRSRKRRGGKT